MSGLGAISKQPLPPSRGTPQGDSARAAEPVDTLVSSQPADSEAGRLARGLIRCSAIDPASVNQVAHDLTALPVNWLKRFDEKHVGVVILKTGQNLADTPLWPAFDPADCEEMITKALPLVDKEVKAFLAGFADIEDPGYRAYQMSLAGDDLKKKVEELSVESGLGFSLKMCGEPKELDVLAGYSGVHGYDEEQLARWKSAFNRLNQGLLEADGGDGLVHPKHGFYLVPFEFYKNREYRPLTVPALQSITGLELSLHDGANYPENHFIALHETVAPDPSPHLGHHRVVLHESGHMVDWLTKAMPEIGPQHEKKVAELYAKALEADKLAVPGQSPILTNRAKDSAGEFFADNLEAYLTMPMNDKADFFKDQNNRVELQKRNPELFSYIDWVMKL